MEHVEDALSQSFGKLRERRIVKAFDVQLSPLGKWSETLPDLIPLGLHVEWNLRCHV